MSPRVEKLEKIVNMPPNGDLMRRVKALEEKISLNNEEQELDKRLKELQTILKKK